MTTPPPRPHRSPTPVSGRTGTAARSLGRDLAPATAVAAMIAVVATIPVPVPSGSPGWTGAAVHVVLYFCLCAALLRPWRARGWPRPSAGPVAATVGYGVLHELWQSVLPHRTAAVGDVLADATGAVLAVFAAAVLGADRRR